MADTYVRMLGGLGGAGAKQDDAPANVVAPVERRADAAYVNEKLLPEISKNLVSVSKLSQFHPKNSTVQLALKTTTELNERTSAIAHNKQPLELDQSIESNESSMVFR